MQIILAGPRGFCAGVNMAIESLEAALGVYGTPLYVYHEIVHNRWVVERFAQQGVVFVNDLAEVPQGAHLLYSAHGVSPEVRGEAAQRRLQRHRRHLPAGDQGPPRGGPLRPAGLHDRLDRPRRARRSGGHDGRGPRRDACWSQTPRGRRRLELPDPDKLAYLTQTTLSRGRRRADHRAGCASGFPKIVGPPKDDICYATQNRQEAVRAAGRRGRRGAGRRQPEQFQ